MAEFDDDVKLEINDRIQVTIKGTDEEIPTVARVCKQHAIDAIVVVGGDDSNTNAALLADRLFGAVQARKPMGAVFGGTVTRDGARENGLPAPADQRPAP